MNKLLLVSVLSVAWLSPLEVLSQAAVKPFGDYSNVRSDGEHAFGYSLSLWMEDGKIIGFIRVHRGLVGDPPAGLLEDVSYNARTGKFSFKAKLSTGLYSDATHRDVPSSAPFDFYRGGEQDTGERKPFVGQSSLRPRMPRSQLY